MQEREADPAMQIRRIMKTMIVLMSRKTGTAMKILKNCSRKDVGWILKIWRIFDEQEEYGNYRNNPDLMNDEDLDELDEWKDN